MKKYTEPLEPETYYHIYNRGNNGESTFKEERNYTYFLELYAKYINPVADTYAYCLLGNHFHFLIRTKDVESIVEYFSTNQISNVVEVPNLNDVEVEVNAAKKMSNQFAKLFNSYTQAINKAYGRTGGLFERPFRRIPVQDDSYLSLLIAYIHRNPEKHGIVEDFKDYVHSSYHTHLLRKKTKLKRKEVLDWYGGHKEYERFHAMYKEDEQLTRYLLE